MLMIRSLPSGWDNNGRQWQWRQYRRAGRRPSKKRSTMLGSITHGVSCALINASASITRYIAGCPRFFTLTQCLDLPA
jgi:hypothetical protein